MFQKEYLDLVNEEENDDCGEEADGTNFLVVEGDGPNDIYKDIVRGINGMKSTVFSRGIETKEVRPATIILNKPRERFLTCPGRLIHPFFQIMESLWILGGRGDIEWICHYLKNMAKYSDGQTEFHGAYGIRMRHSGCHRDSPDDMTGLDQFKNCYDYLKKDPDTRHACMSLWNPQFDHVGVTTNDRPCNVFLHFLIRNGKLDLTIFNRSNDVHWGLFNTNVVQFSVILETMAMLLDLPIGKQIHMTNSLHMYMDHSQITDRVLNAKYEFNMYDHVDPMPFELPMVPESTSKIHILGTDLRIFFDFEAKYRVGFENDSRCLFNYSNEALVLAKAFDSYKNDCTIDSVQCLSRLKADDIYITCVEFVARKVSDDFKLDKIVELVLMRLSHVKDLKKVIEYITLH